MSHFELNDDRADCNDFAAIFADPPPPAPEHANSHLPDCDCSAPDLSIHNGAKPCPAYCAHCLGNLPEPPPVPTPEQVREYLSHLQATDPAAYLRLGTLVQAFAKGVTQTQAYKHVEGAGKAIRRTLHETEVI